MRTIDTLKHVCAWVACLGVLSPAATFGAAPEVQNQRSVSQIKDVELSNGGVLVGQVVDQQGNKLSTVAVELIQSGRQVAQTTTNEAGQFSVSGLTGGTYEVASMNGTIVYRAWTADTAPPTASQGVLLVAPQSIVRGQCATGNCGGGMQGIPQYSGQMYGGEAYGGQAYGGATTYGQPMGGEVLQGQAVQGQVYGQPMGGEMVQGQMVQGPMVEGAAVQGQPIYGPWVQGQPIPVAEGAVYGGGPMGPVAPMRGGGGFGFLANPWIIGGAVAAAIAIPLALDDDDDDFRPPSS